VSHQGAAGQIRRTPLKHPKKGIESKLYRLWCIKELWQCWWVLSDDLDRKACFSITPENSDERSRDFELLFRLVYVVQSASVG
jgi:hypothetical protein